MPVKIHANFLDGSEWIGDSATWSDCKPGPCVVMIFWPDGTRYIIANESHCNIIETEKSVTVLHHVLGEAEAIGVRYDYTEGTQTPLKVALFDDNSKFSKAFETGTNKDDIETKQEEAMAWE